MAKIKVVKRQNHKFLLVVLILIVQTTHSQCFITGADLSYVNKITECGGVYRNELGNIAEPFSLFAEKGANMIRLRLWHTPENIIDYCGNPITSCNIDDVLAAAQLIEANGMSLNLGIHYGDYFNDIYSMEIKKAIHITESTATWLVNLFFENNIRNYEVIGLSYYPHFSQNTSLEEIGDLVYYLKTYYSREVILFETGITWSNDNADNYGNFLGNGNMSSYGVSPEGQRQYLLDLALVIYENHGDGLIYWEPGWISSDMCDLWGQGSSYENASFFNFHDNNKALPAIEIFDFCNSFSINDFHDQYELIIYQNPYNFGQITLRTKIPLSEWMIYSSQGRLLQQGHFTHVQTSHSISFGSMPSGIYIVQFITEGGRILTRKVVL